MEVLSHDVFVNTLEKCNALPRYKVGFCFATYRDAHQFAESIKELFDDEGIPGVRNVYCDVGGGRTIYSGMRVWIVTEKSLSI